MDRLQDGIKTLVLTGVREHRGEAIKLLLTY
jgi:hypothetical protein